MNTFGEFIQAANLPNRCVRVYLGARGLSRTPAPTAETGFRVRIPQSPSQAPVPAPFRQGGLWRALGAGSFDSLCSLRMTARDGRRNRGITPYGGTYWPPLQGEMSPPFAAVTEGYDLSYSRGKPWRAADSRPYSEFDGDIESGAFPTRGRRRLCFLPYSIAPDSRASWSSPEGDSSAAVISPSPSSSGMGRRSS